MHRLKELIRRVIAAALYYSGLLWIYAEFKLQGKVVILAYHRVLPLGANSFSADGIVVTPETFAAQMAFLKRYFLPLSIAQLRNALCGSGFPRRASVVTFDDGWQDTAGHALPILARFNVPAVVFVATAYLGANRVFWQERLTRLLFAASRSDMAGREILRQLGVQHACLIPDGEARRAVRDAVTAIKLSRPTHADMLIEQLEVALAREAPAALDQGDDRFMDWAELQKLIDSGLVTVGSHAHTHTPLPTLGYGAAKAELERSRRELEAHGVPNVWTCAYPNGDVDDSTAAAAFDAGYELAFTTEHGLVHLRDDPMRLCRINIHEHGSGTNAEFLCRILGIF